MPWDQHGGFSSNTIPCSSTWRGLTHNILPMTKELEQWSLYLAFYSEGESIPPTQPATGQEEKSLDRKGSLKSGLAGLYHDPNDQGEVLGGVLERSWVGALGTRVNLSKESSPFKIEQMTKDLHQILPLLYPISTKLRL